MATQNDMKPAKELTSEELTSEDLFRQALQKQAEEISQSLRDVYNVKIGHVSLIASSDNWITDVIVTLAGDVLNAEHISRGYSILKNVRVSNGHLILNLSENHSKVPLIDGYIDQIYCAGEIITTISVVKKKMKQ